MPRPSTCSRSTWPTQPRPGSTSDDAERALALYEAGVVAAGLEGSNEQQRKAKLAIALACDADYRTLRDAVINSGAALPMLTLRPPLLVSVAASCTSRSPWPSRTAFWKEPLHDSAHRWWRRR
jgi:hypothetical protein